MPGSVRDFQGSTPVTGHRVYIDPSSVIIGDVVLGDDVSVWPMAVIRGDVNLIRIGNSSNIQDGAILHVTHDGPYTPGGKPLLLGQGITVGHQAVLHGCTIDGLLPHRDGRIDSGCCAYRTSCNGRCRQHGSPWKAIGERVFVPWQSCAPG